MRGGRGREGEGCGGGMQLRGGEGGEGDICGSMMHAINIHGRTKTTLKVYGAAMWRLSSSHKSR